MGKEMSRRSFLKAGTAAAIGLSMTPGNVFANVDQKKKKKQQQQQAIELYHYIHHVWNSRAGCWLYYFLY